VDSAETVPWRKSCDVVELPLQSGRNMAVIGRDVLFVRCWERDPT
jgi:hypothetical protein